MSVFNLLMWRGTSRIAWVRSTGVLLLAFVAAGVGCERAPSSPASQSATNAGGKSVDRPSTMPAGAASAPALRDYTIHPMVDAEEQHTTQLRIVSLAPTLTEICAALGAADQVVGRTKYCVHPPSVQGAASLGGLTDLSREMLVSLRPDLVLVSGTSRDVVDALDGLALRYVCLPDETLADLEQSIREVGRLIHRPRTAEALVSAIRADLDRVAAGARHTAASESVLLLVGVLSDPPSPPFVAGPRSFYDELLTMAGHRNAAAPLANRAFAALSLEAIVQANPHVIVELDPEGQLRPGGDAEALAAWKRVGSLAATDTGRIVVIRGPELYLLGPRVAIAYERIVAAIERR